MSETTQNTREESALVQLHARDRALAIEIGTLQGRQAEVQDLINLLESSGRKRRPRVSGEAQATLPVGEC